MRIDLFKREGGFAIPRPAFGSRNKTTRKPVNATRRSRSRVLLTTLVFAVGYATIIGRLVTLGMAETAPSTVYATAADGVSQARPDIRDRNGVLLATDVRTPSLYAEPHRILDVDEAIELLTAAVPEFDTGGLRAKLKSDKRFVWLKRELTPEQRDTIHNFGIPGIGFIEENRRFYPSGRLTSHVVGHVNIDNAGIAGIEKHIDSLGLADLHDAGFARSDEQAPVTLSLDVRVQHALRDEILNAMETFSAKAGAGVVLNVRNGEVLALVSMPDYDPNQPETALEKDAINRITAGVYELGSTFKAFTVAMALDSGEADFSTTYDARSPIRVASFTINDFHAERRILTLPEVFVHSSNIGTAKMALAAGIERHKEFMERFGFFQRPHTELPESALPLTPQRWTDLASMTISFGHGFSVAPIQAAAGGAALMNGGLLIPPTFFQRSERQAKALAKQVIQPSTSDMMRELFRMNVDEGTAKKAGVLGYRVGGKTGTAEKVVDGRYSNTKLLTSFISAFPTDNPEYLMLLMLDEPQGIKETHGYRTSGWNAVPTSGKVITRIAPLLGVTPVLD
ncbi:peptidoglycan D,D-transpeptidase FtsI family protein [Tepidamorphus sp. 3E244]|uniref:peptidoglycan D,D-transpeptidase FtsI family protein n=1 Tax=Tepidamorphus sp. 3E244 TaxID=3385498 RepID=UPI0038FCC9E3